MPDAGIIIINIIIIAITICKFQYNAICIIILYQSFCKNTANGVSVHIRLKYLIIHWHICVKCNQAVTDGNVAKYKTKPRPQLVQTGLRTGLPTPGHTYAFKHTFSKPFIEYTHSKQGKYQPAYINNQPTLLTQTCPQTVALLSLSK